MLKKIVEVFKGCVSSILLVTNVLVIFTAMIPFALLKLCLPFVPVRKFSDSVLNFLIENWIRINGLWIALAQRIRWNVTGVDGLKRRGWYLVSSNHQSWVDILVLQKVLTGRVPFVKFFLKRELIWVPVMGLAWWALDFPFMRRGSGKSSQARDMAETRKSCERFKLVPTSVINFMEGTRFTPGKHKSQGSPYRNLLKPKLGGMSMALATMGDQFDSMLDVTIVYPQGVPTFWDLLAGRVSEVVVRVKEVPIPADLRVGDEVLNPAYRAHLQSWVADLWAEKDRHIDEIKVQFAERGRPKAA